MTLKRFKNWVWPQLVQAVRRQCFRQMSRAWKIRLFRVACITGDTVNLKKWVRIRPDLVNQVDDWGNWPLTQAIFHWGKVDTIRVLLEGGANPNQIDYDSPLLLAAYRGDQEIVAVLKSYGARVTESEGAWFDASTGDAASLERRILQSPETLHLCDRDGKTALHCAATHGHEASIRLLVQYGADLNMCDSIGQTPLFVAARNGHAGAVKLLLDLGANASIGDRAGWSPLKCAESQKHDAVAELLRPQTVSVA